MSSKPGYSTYKANDANGIRESFCRWIYFHLRPNIFFWLSQRAGAIAPPPYGSATSSPSLLQRLARCIMPPAPASARIAYAAADAASLSVATNLVNLYS